MLVGIIRPFLAFKNGPNEKKFKKGRMVHFASISSDGVMDGSQWRDREPGAALRKDLGQILVED